MRVKKVISGGQTGADQAGLYAAQKLGLETGGWMPKGCKTQAGNKPGMALKFGMKEHVSHKYPARTMQNVRDSDATIIFGDQNSPGSKLTKRYCQERQKPFLQVPFSLEYDGETVARIKDWLTHVTPTTLNIAGNREETQPGIGQWVYGLLLRALA